MSTPESMVTTGVSAKWLVSGRSASRSLMAVEEARQAVCEQGVMVKSELPQLQITVGGRALGRKVLRACRGRWGGGHTLQLKAESA